MFLLILESIGTSELIFIAIIALIVLGPRKLPQMAKTVAKTMGEFKSATNEFKSTWEKEVAFEDDNLNPKAPMNSIAVSQNENTIDTTIKNQTISEQYLSAPEVKELSAEEIAQNFRGKIDRTEKADVDNDNVKSSGKQDWL